MFQVMITTVASPQLKLPRHLVSYHSIVTSFDTKTEADNAVRSINGSKAILDGGYRISKHATPFYPA